MNFLVDIIIIAFILIGGIIGYKRGVIKQAVCSFGLIVVIILAYFLKNPVSVFLYNHLPFFSFGGVIKGVTVLNILVYEAIAFLIVLSILLILLKLVVFASKVIQNVLDFTVILGSLSSILGSILGLIEYFIIAFILIYILSLPMFNINFFNDSKLKDNILNNTPALSKVIEKPRKVINEFEILKEEYKTEKDPNKFNLDTLDLFLKYDVIEVDSAINLVNKNKLKIKGVNDVINKYKED